MCASASSPSLSSRTITAKQLVMIPNVKMDEQKSYLWLNDKAIGTSAINSCLGLMFFYTQYGFRRILVRHVSQLSCSPFQNLLRDIQDMIGPTSSINGICFFGLTENNALSASIAKEIKETVETNIGPVLICGLQMHFEYEREQISSQSTALCRYENDDDSSHGQVIIATYAHVHDEDKLVSLFEFDIKDRLAYFHPTYDGNNEFHLEAGRLIRTRIEENIGTDRIKINNDQGRKDNLLAAIETVERNTGKEGEEKTDEKHPEKMISSDYLSASIDSSNPLSQLSSLVHGFPH